MDYKDEILQEKFKRIKETRGTDDFETAFELLKETVNELCENFDEALKNKDEDIKLLLGVIETVIINLNYYRNLSFEESKKKFENFIDQYIDQIYLFLPEFTRLTIENNLLLKQLKIFLLNKIKKTFYNYSEYYAYTLAFLQSTRIFRIYEIFIYNITILIFIIGYINYIFKFNVICMPI